ncbi:hypothetical protein [Acinetobacter terrae]|uniref:hypothetical protein n=1 Tax=Acinetobacter terrae TaxID=2731247 RepID=UPI0007D788BE|nr:hypothetical protein [Acinetobacter terrae]OAL80364.1 hypothetical protein AY608_05670 [Acinetobacter terrae]
MATVFKSDKVATVSMGNINGIKGPQDFALFLDFENGIYQSKSLGATNGNYTLTDVVEVTRSNLSGEPITVSKLGIEKKIASTTELRTMLLANGRFGVLQEDIRQNFFLNSSAPVTQTISVPAGLGKIIVSCVGTGSIVVTGDVAETNSTVTENTPKAFTKNATGVATNLTLTLSGSLSHVQVEVTSGATTASSKITTTGAAAFRNREFVKVKQSLFDSLIQNKSGFTVLSQTIDTNTAINSVNHASNRLGIDTTTGKVIAMSGVNAALNMLSYTVGFVGSTPTTGTNSNGAIAGSQLFKPYNNAMAINNGFIKSAHNGLLKPTIDVANPLTASGITLGHGYDGGYAGLNGIVTKLVVYDRILSDVEIVEITNSWL